MKKFLFIVRHPPQQGIALSESLDLMMTVAAFDQSVRVLFLDDGVFSLKSGQSHSNPAVKPSASMFGALEVYDIKELFVEVESLTERGLTVENLILPARLIRRTEIAGLIALADHVVTA